MKENRKVLIIDDDNRNIFALRAVLKSKGYQSLSAISAKEGMDFLKNDTDIGIILMDMMMPDTDGYEAIRQLKASEQFREIPMIAVTAQAMPGDREKCLEAGADDYISKPIDVDLLVRILSSHL